MLPGADSLVPSVSIVGGGTNEESMLGDVVGSLTVGEGFDSNLIITD